MYPTSFLQCLLRNTLRILSTVFEGSAAEIGCSRRGANPGGHGRSGATSKLSRSGARGFGKRDADQCRLPARNTENSATARPSV